VTPAFQATDSPFISLLENANQINKKSTIHSVVLGTDSYDLICLVIFFVGFTTARKIMIELVKIHQIFLITNSINVKKAHQ